MPTTRQCAECGTPLPDDVPEGACPVCALRGALELPDVSSQAAVTEQPGDRIGRYKLLEKIGEGGCGIVYMAEQTEPIRRRVALKIVKLGMDTKQVIARFEAERQALALMDHPNIAKVLDAGATDTGRPYFVMELVRGIKITDYCDQHNLSTRERLDLFIQVCHAVQHAHQKGIIHRDLKPSNVLVTELDGAPVPKVIDFGIAKATSQQLLTDKTLFTAFQQFVGTPAYMSPEQAGMSGADIDTRSDIYALGVLLYELVTGHVPFEKEELLQAGLDEMRRLIREKEPLKPSTRLSSLSVEDLTTVAKHQRTEPPKLLHLVRGDLDWIVMKCLEKDRNRRYETANGLASDLGRHLNDEPVTARPPGTLYRFQKAIRRNKLAFAAGSAVALALGLGIVGSSWQALRANRAERERTRLYYEAEQARQTAQANEQRAEQSAAQVKVALSASDFKEAVRLIAEDECSDALAYLARSLVANPTNAGALTRLTTLLTYHSWPLPITGTIKHSGEVSSAQFSPDGLRIVTASADQTARVWDAQTGQPLTGPMKHNDKVISAQFSPDGKRVFTTSLDGAARVWSAQSGQLLTEVMTQHGNVEEIWDARSSQMLTQACKLREWDFSANFSPDGKQIVTAYQNARVWDAESGQPLTEPMQQGSEHHVGAHFAQFSPDGKRVVIASDNLVRVWNAQTGQPLTEPMNHESQNGHVLSAQFSPDGRRIVTASLDSTARVWDAQTGQPLTEPIKHRGYVSSAQFSPDGKYILTASQDGTARVWDAQTGKPLVVWDAQTTQPQLEPMKHKANVCSARFSPDGHRIATASWDGTARVWDAQTGQPLTEPMQHNGWVNSAQFSPDGKRLVTASWDGTARVCDAQTGQPLSKAMPHNGDSWDSHPAQFSPDGKRILTVSTNAARVWDVENGQPLTKPMQHDAWVDSAEFSPDGMRIVTTSTNTARVWDAQTGQPLTEPMNHESHNGHVFSAQFSPDGRRIVTASLDGTARVWDVRTGQPLTEPMKHDGWVKSAQFSPDGRRIVTVSVTAFAESTAQIWDAQTGQPLTAPTKGHIRADWARFSPDGERFVTAFSNTAQVRNAETGQPLTEPMQHGGGVFSAQFSPDGNRIVTAAFDGAARVWDAQTGQLLIGPMKHRGAVHSALFSPDGKRIVTASFTPGLRDGAAQIWDAQTGQPLTEPMKEDDWVWSAHFSPDGKRIVTISHAIARVWDIGPCGTGFPDWLLPLAEALSEKKLTQQGLLEATGQDPAPVIGRIRQQLEQAPGNDDWVVWGRWFLADRGMRTISPFSKVTIPQYRQRQGPN